MIKINDVCVVVVGSIIGGTTGYITNNILHIPFPVSLFISLIAGFEFGYRWEALGHRMDVS